MDLEIDVGAITNKSSELESLANAAKNINNDFSGSYLNKLSSTEISSLSSNLQKNLSRLEKGYNNSKNWLNNYLNELGELESNLANCKSGGETVTEFKSDFADIFTKITVPALKTDGDKTVNYSLAPLYIGEHLISYKLNGQTFYIVNTKISVEDYANYITKNGMYQNAGFQGSECMLLSQYYASDMLSGKYTSKSAMDSHSGAPAVKMNEGKTSTEEKDVLEYIYQELNEGNPCVLQVTQKMSYKGWRHNVTVVGYASDVKSAADLTPDKILVLDCVDGKIQTLAERNRKPYNQGNKYLAYGPTESFKSSIGLSA